MIGSPYFSVGLAIAGILWLAFVGEPRRGIQRHHWLPYLGWSVFAVCLTAIVITAGWGAINLYIKKEAAKISGPGWHLTEEQRTSFIKNLDAIPKKDRYPINIRCLLASTQSQSMALELNEILNEHGWSANISADQRLRPDIVGINIEYAEDLAERRDKDSPFHGIDFYRLLASAGINATFGSYEGFNNDSVTLAIGSKPLP